MRQAMERAQEHLLGTASAEALLAQRELGKAPVRVGKGLKARIKELLGSQDDEGSWEGDLLRTAEMLLLLHDLGGGAGGAERSPEVERAAAWLRARQRQAGRYSDGCDDGRHALGLCHHFLGGFFSAGPPQSSMAGLRLATGVTLPTDSDARFAASCAALQSLFRWGYRSPDLELHVEGLRRMLGLWQDGAPGQPAPAAFVPALAALLEAPEGTGGVEAAEQALEWLPRKQRGDGTWPGIDSLHMLELLQLARERGRGRAAVNRALRHGAELLAIAQQKDGSWGSDAGARRTLIGWRALRVALSDETRDEPNPTNL